MPLLVPMIAKLKRKGQWMCLGPAASWGAVAVAAKRQSRSLATKDSFNLLREIPSVIPCKRIGMAANIDVRTEASCSIRGETTNDKFHFYSARDLADKTQSAGYHIRGTPICGDAGKPARGRAGYAILGFCPSRLCLFALILSPSLCASFAPPAIEKSLLTITRNRATL